MTSKGLSIVRKERVPYTNLAVVSVLDQSMGTKGYLLEVKVGDAPVLVEQVLQLALPSVQGQVAHEHCAGHAAAGRDQVGTRLGRHEALPWPAAAAQAWQTPGLAGSGD